MIRSRLSPEAKALAADTQMACPLTQENNSHQCSPSRFARSPLACSQISNRGFLRHEASSTLVVLKAPNPVQTPGEIFERVAQMYHLPIEHADDNTGCIKQQVASAVIAMHDGQPGGRRRGIAAQPADDGALHGLRFDSIRVENIDPNDRVAFAKRNAGSIAGNILVRPQAVGSVRAMSPRMRHLCRAIVGCRAAKGGAINRNGLASPPVISAMMKKGCPRATEFLLEPEWFRHRHGAAEKRSQRFEFDAAIGVDQATGGIEAQDQAALAHGGTGTGPKHEAECFARGTARDALETLRLRRGRSSSSASQGRPPAARSGELWRRASCVSALHRAGP